MCAFLSLLLSPSDWETGDWIILIGFGITGLSLWWTGLSYSCRASLEASFEIVMSELEIISVALFGEDRRENLSGFLALV